MNLDPNVASEIKKTRSCVVISPNEMNKYLNTVIITPMTSISRNYPTQVKVDHNKKQGWIVIDQIRTIDKQRIIKILDELTEKEIAATKVIIRETLMD